MSRGRLELPGGAMLEVVPAGTEVLVNPSVGGRPAAPGDGAFAGMLEAMRLALRVDRFTAWAAGPVRERLEGERAIEVDQSNESVVVGEEAVVKRYPRTAAGPQPGLDLPLHLAAVGFAAIPAPLGAIVWRDDEGRDVLLATAAAYLPGARDGWAWYLERVLAWLGGDTDEERAFGPATVLGDLAAWMHAALATASPTIPEPIRVADEETMTGWRETGLATLAEAMAVTDGQEGERLCAREANVRAALAGLGQVTPPPLTRVHGDFHVGQVLEWEGGFAITDFDGDPVAPIEARAAFDTPVRDVAAFVRSIDHLGRIAQVRVPGRDGDIEVWIERTREEFLEAYTRGLHGRGCAALFDERLLHPLEVIQELHEYVYAAHFLPRWRYVPDLAMRALFPEPGA